MCDGEYPRVKRVDRKYGCVGCFNNQHLILIGGREIHYCKTLITDKNCQVTSTEIIFTYQLIDENSKTPSKGCPLSERWS